MGELAARHVRPEIESVLTTTDGMAQEPHPHAISLSLPWGPAVRGLRWPGGVGTAVLIHEPGADLDAWRTLPAALAATLDLEVTAWDLPGHGLSDDPWDLSQVTQIVKALFGDAGRGQHHFAIAAGESAFAALNVAANQSCSGLVLFTPRDSDDAIAIERSPAVPKLFLAGALSGNDVSTARRLARDSGGWSIVTSLPETAGGTTLLASGSAAMILDQIGVFLGDCLFRSREPAD